MAVSTFSMATNLVVNNQVVTGNGSFVAWTSATLTNSQAMSGCKLACTVSGMTPDPEGATPTTYNLCFSLESSNDNGSTWYPIVTQFDPLVNPVQGSTIILMVSPSVFNPDEGISYDDWNGSSVVSRTSRRQDVLGALFHAKLYVNEFGYGGAGAFQSCTISVVGERFDA